MSKKNRRPSGLTVEGSHLAGPVECEALRKNQENRNASNIYYDDEQLLNAGDEGEQAALNRNNPNGASYFEDEDDQADERHQLIARGSANSLRRSQSRRLLDDETHQRSHTQGQKNAQHVAQEDTTFLQSGLKNPLRHLFTFVAASLRSPSNRASYLSQFPAFSPNLHEHKADFVFRTDNLDGDDDETAPQWDHTIDGFDQRLRGAYQSNDNVKLAGQGGGGTNHQRSHTSKRRRARAAWCNYILLLVLALSMCFLTFKVWSLIHNERKLLIQPANRIILTNYTDWLVHDDESTATTGRQHELVEELKKNLDSAHRAQLEADRQQRWLVSSPKCHIPVIEPWDESIMDYVRRKPPLNCSALLEGILADNESAEKEALPEGTYASTLSYVLNNRLYFSNLAVNMGALSQAPARPGECCYREIVRSLENDDDLEWAPSCLPISEQGQFLNVSLIEVRCASWNYTNVHAFIKHQEEEEAALLRVAREKLNPDGDFYSVLLIGVDTISRLNGKRQLANTLKTLKDLYPQTLEFVGYNKVAENTFPNLIPLLTGLKPEQLNEVQCWQSGENMNDPEASESADDYLDNCKFLWNFYQQAGYLTYIGEDWPQASTFNYLKPGFKSQPSTYYGRPFTLARDGIVYPAHRSGPPGCAACQLDRPLVEVDLDNLRAFIQDNPKGLPYFALHWINCPQHDDLNGASEFDHTLAKFFADMKQKFEQDRTFVVFFSDHGYRWNKFVSTRVGHYESSLPMLTIAPPRDFILRHPDLYERLQSHQNALVTPFDIFHTFIDLRNLGMRKNTTAARQTGTSGSSLDKRPSFGHPSAPEVRIKRDQSFIVENVTPIAGRANVITLVESGATEVSRDASATTSSSVYSTASVEQVKLLDGTSYKQNFQTISLLQPHSSEQLNRGCIEAGIPDNYCVCHQFQPVASNRTDVLGAAYYLVYVHLEARLANHLDICQPLELERVHHAEMFNIESSPKTRESSRRHKRASKAANERRLTSPKPANKHSHLHGANDDQNKHDYLPQREYSIMFSTKPGGGLFQEVVRLYGTDMKRCRAQIRKARMVVEDERSTLAYKLEAVLAMNDVCDFSVHSESLSRFNLYKDQSKCVKSNTELKKICYCNDLLKRAN